MDNDQLANHTKNNNTSTYQLLKVGHGIAQAVRRGPAEPRKEAGGQPAATTKLCSEQHAWQQNAEKNATRQKQQNTCSYCTIQTATLEGTANSKQSRKQQTKSNERTLQNTGNSAQTKAQQGDRAHPRKYTKNEAKTNLSRPTTQEQQLHTTNKEHWTDPHIMEQ